MTWADYLKEYEEYSQDKYALNSIKAHTRDLKKFIAFTPASCPEEVKPEEFKQFIDKMREELDMTMLTQRRAVSTYKQFFRYLNSKGIVDNSIVDAIRSDDVICRKERIKLTNQEVQKLLDSIKWNRVMYRNKAMIEAIYCSGISQYELCELKLSDIDFDKSCMLIRSNYKKLDRVLPMARSMKEAIQVYLRQERYKITPYPGCEDYLFLSANGNKVELRSFMRTMDFISKHSGLKKKVTTEMLRYSFQYIMAYNGADFLAIQTMVGVSNTTKLGVNLKYLRHELKQFHPRA